MVVFFLDELRMGYELIRSVVGWEMSLTGRSSGVVVFFLDRLVVW